MNERNTDGGRILTRTQVFEFQKREIRDNLSERLGATGRAGSSVVERSIAARMVTGSIRSRACYRVSPERHRACYATASFYLSKKIHGLHCWNERNTDGVGFSQEHKCLSFKREKSATI